MSLSHQASLDVETRLARWASGLSLPDFPPAVLSVARACISDGVAVMLAGSATPVYAQASTLVQHGGACCLADGQGSAGAASAAQLNGVACHALDFDDTSFAGIVHGTAVVLPAVLAVAQETGASGTQLMEAFIAGVEVEYALGLALTDSLYERGFWATATLGVIGAATGAARLLRLDTQATANAIRLAANQPIGLRATHGANGKPYLCGVAARAGVEAAYAARAGIAGQPGTFERARGYASTLNGGVLALRAIEALGTRHALLDPGIAFKLRPMCSAMQAAVEAAITLRADHGWTHGQVTSIRCHATPLAVASLPYRTPTQPSEAQFCMPFAIACTLLHGDVRIEHLDDATLANPALRQLMQRVELLEDTALVPREHALRYPEAARVEIGLDDGRLLSHTILAATGMPDRPASEQVLRDKFLDCATRVLPPAPAQALWDRLRHLEYDTSVRGLLSAAVSAGRT